MQFAITSNYFSNMKLYLDNNIFIYIENGTLQLTDIENLIEEPIERIFFSSAHIQETLEIKGKDEKERLERINTRLKTIEKITHNNYIFENLKNEVYELIESPYQVIKTITEVPAQSIMKSFINIISEEQKREIRRQLNIEPAKINLYNYNEVVEQLSEKLRQFGDYSFLEMIELGISYHKDGKTFGLSNRTAAIFELLDMLGYWKDKSTEKSNYARLWDSTHVFYSIYCDYFISSDKRTANKAKVVFDLYNVKTKIISPKI
jgi:hypothetical protein